MGIVLPQVVTEDRASGAVDFGGSLAFNSRKSQSLTRTPGSAGNRKTWTYSVWVKRDNKGTGAQSNHCCLFSADNGSANDNTRMHMFFGAGNQDYIQHDLHSSSPRRSTAAFRDLTGWYHVCISLDTTTGGNDSVYSQIQWWVNGRAITDQQGGWSTQNALTEDGDYGVNGNWLHRIGANNAAGPGQFWDGRMSQATMVDGARLGPSYFGYTDPLTGVWRPKKFEAGESTPNDGRVWSTMLTTSSGSINNAGNAFNGKTDDFANSSATDPVFTFTPTGGIKYRDSVRIWLRTALHKARLNGGEYKFNTGAPTGGYWLTLDEGNGGGTITTIDAQYTSGSLTAINAIEVDGVILKDSTTLTTAFGTNGFYLPFDGKTPIGKDQSGQGNHWQPDNFGGYSNNSEATGALPIRNTSNNAYVSRPGAIGSDVSKNYTVTVANPGSGNKYYFDGALSANPTLHRGGTYTFDYTAASSHPLFLSSLLDGKHNSKAYSVSFDGTGDALRVADHADLRFGTGAFTIECYVWFNSFDDTYPSILSKYTGGTASWIMRVKNDGKAIFYTGVGGGTNNESSASVISLNRWHHIAMVREGTGSNQAKMYVDGKLVITATDNTDYTDTQEVTIGAQNASDSNVLNGYMSNVRIIKGTALYTSNFTPPGTTLTNVTGTTLLCCQDSAATTAVVIPSGSITVAGNPAATQAKQPFLYDNNHGNFGVNTATSNVTKITVPHIAADRLYYYCNSHPNMGSYLDVKTDLTKADPYAWKCFLACPLDGVTNDLSNFINCNATEKTVTPNGVTRSRADYNFYGESMYFDGSNDLISADTASDGNFDFGTEDFTAEIWVRPTSTGGDQYIMSWEGAGADASHHGMNIYNNAWRIGGFNNYLQGGDVGLTSQKWSHIAISRIAGVMKVFVNGTNIGNVNWTSSISCTNSFTLGRYSGSGAHYFQGYMQDWRVYKGVAKYTDDFIPASASNPDIFVQPPSGFAGKSKLKTIPTTNGSISFGYAQNDYLDLADHADTRLTNTFSIEFFYNETGNRAAGAFITDGGGSSNPFSSGTPNGISYQFYHNAGAIYLNWSNGSGTWYNIQNISMPSSDGWHHLVVTNDNTRTRLFINGELVGSHSEHDWGVATSGRKVYIGTMSAGPGTGTQGNYNSHGFMSNIRICNGSVPTEYATTATAAGTKVFIPPSSPLTTTSQGATANHVKLLCAQSQTSATAAAVSPVTINKNNHVTGSNFSPFPVDIDAIRGKSGVYCTLNPVGPGTGTIQDGQLTLNTSSSTADVGNMIMDTGKFYWEVTLESGSYPRIGVYDIDGNNPGDLGGTAAGWCILNSPPRVYHNASASNYGNFNGTVGDVIGIAYDADAGKIWYSVNGLFFNSGDPVGGNNPSQSGVTGNGIVPAVSSGSGGGVYHCNFGQKAYKFPPPTGYQPLNSTTARPDTVIARPDQFFKAVRGNFDTQKTWVTGFKPDFVWYKSISNTDGHELYDSVRGVNKALSTPSLNAQATRSGGLTSFNNDGFTHGTYGLVSNSDEIAWCWKAGGGPTATNNNTSGAMDANSVSIDGVLQPAYTPSGSVTIYPVAMSIGTKNGFSIVQYQGNGSAGATVPHGLSQTPDFTIIKAIDSVTDGSWFVAGNWAPGYGRLLLNATSNDNGSPGNSVANDLWNNTAPNNQKITLGGYNGINDSGDDYIMYNWHNVPGVQKFGKYTGNNDGDGPYIELGFKPAMIWLKAQSTTGNWVIIDTLRPGFNSEHNTLVANDNATHNASGGTTNDILATGFKIRGTTDRNAAQTYIYAAWAETPEFNLYGAQSTAI